MAIGQQKSAITDVSDEFSLANPELYQEFRTYSDEMINLDSLDYAKQILRLLPEMLAAEPDLPAANPEFFNTYEDILLKAKIIAMPIIAPEEVIGLFKEHLMEIFALREKIDLWEKIRVKCLMIYLHEDRDVFKSKLRAALLNNSEEITSDLIGAEQLPTVGNWLRNYIAYVGSGQVETVKQLEYLSQNENFNKLSENEKANIKLLLEVYERLKLSSLTPEGLEENVTFDLGDGKLRVLKQGRVEIIDLEEVAEENPGLRALLVASGLENSEDRTATIIKAYQGSQIEEDSVLVLEKRIQAETGGDIQKISDILWQTVNAPLAENMRVEKTLAALRLLAAVDRLDGLLRDDERFIKFFTSYLKENYPEPYLEDYRLYPAAPKNMSLFLQYILKDKLGKNTNDSARIGMRLVNLLKKAGNDKYMKMVYYDTDQKIFVWS